MCVCVLGVGFRGHTVLSMQTVLYVCFVCAFELSAHEGGMQEMTEIRQKINVRTPPSFALVHHAMTSPLTSV